MIVERNDELRLLGSLLDGIEKGGGRVVLIRGEAGIGKSALTAEFLESVDATAHVLFGTCDDLLTPQPLGPIWDMARTEPALSDPLSSEDPGAVMVALIDLLSRELRPTVAVIEDTQWAGEAMLDVIKFLGRRIVRTNGLLILTYRDGEVDAEHPLRQVIGDLPPGTLERLQLAPLSESAVASMLDSSFNVHDVMALTDGNPLFVTEVAASGIEGVPTSIQESVLARAARLSPASRRLLNLLSIIPGSAERSLVVSILDPTDDDLAECKRHGLLRTDATTISFPHDLQRRAIESTLSEADKRRLAGEVLANLDADVDPSLLAHFATEASDVAAIVEFAPLAARAAAAMGSHRESVAHYRNLEPYLVDTEPNERAAIIEDWAREEFYMANPRSVELMDQAVELRRSLDDDHALALSLSFAGTVNRQYSGTEIAMQHSYEAIEILEGLGPSSELAESLNAYAFLKWINYEHDPEALAIAKRALAMAEEMGDAKATIGALRSVGMIEFTRGNAEGMKLVEASLHQAIDAGFRYDEVRGLANIAGLAGDSRDVRRALDFGRRARDTAARYELHNLEANTIAMNAEFLLWIGDWEAAESAASEALGTIPDVEVTSWRVLGTVHARRGRSEARVALDRMWERAEDFGLFMVSDPAAAALAEYIWLTGDEDPAWTDRLEQILEQGIATGTPWPSGAFMFWMWKLGRIAEPPDSSADFYRWIVTGEYRKAADFWEKQGVPYEQAVALMHGDEAEQIDALRILESLGAAATARKLRGLLIASGAKVPRGPSQSTRTNEAGLTARQAEVLELLAGGFTNAEIADSLFVSHRTVENHVSAILMKLEAPNREKAVTVAYERGILN